MELKLQKEAIAAIGFELKEVKTQQENLTKNFETGNTNQSQNCGLEIEKSFLSTVNENSIRQASRSTEQLVKDCR